MENIEVNLQCHGFIVMLNHIAEIRTAQSVATREATIILKQSVKAMESCLAPSTRQQNYGKSVLFVHNIRRKCAQL